MGAVFEFVDDAPTFELVDDPKPTPRKRKPKPKQDVPVFMEFVRVVWNARFPGCKPPPESVKCLRGVYEALGDEEATNRLRRYLHSSPAQYINLHRFSQTHSEWAEEAPRGEFRPQPTPRYREGKRVAQEAAESLALVLQRTVPPKPVDVQVDPVTGRLRPV